MYHSATNTTAKSCIVNLFKDTSFQLYLLVCNIPFQLQQSLFLADCLIELFLTVSDKRFDVTVFFLFGGSDLWFRADLEVDTWSLQHTLVQQTLPWLYWATVFLLFYFFKVVSQCHSYPLNTDCRSILLTSKNLHNLRMPFFFWKISFTIGTSYSLCVGWGEFLLGGAGKVWSK